jgi:hypothetical protein
MAGFLSHFRSSRARRFGAVVTTALLALALSSCTVVAGPKASDAPEQAPGNPPDVVPTSLPAELPGGDTPKDDPALEGHVVDLGNDLSPYVRLRGDQVVVVPDGWYKAGSVVSAPHPTTSGPLKGWLVLKAQTRGNVVVDLSRAAITLDGSTNHVLFVGFRFVNGPIYANGSDIAFWYTDHTFPANVWASQGGRYSSADTVHAYAPSSNRIEFYGSDLHDTGDAIDVSNSNGTRLEGVKTWNLSDMGVDPQDRIHADAIDGVAGNVTSLRVVDSWIKGRVILEDWNGSKGGPNEDIRFVDTWVSNSPSSGFIFTAAKPSSPRGLFGELVDVRSFSNKNGYGRIDIVDGRQYYSPNSNPSRVNIAHSGYSTTPPAAGEQNPADAWRAAHGYDGWSYVLSR